jgi:hypothetical protein
MMVRQIARAALLAGIAIVAYVAIIVALGQRAQPSIMFGLALLALGTEALWAVVRWLSPLRGMFGEPDQELALVRTLEREISRSLRHQAPLVIVAVLGRWNLSPRAVSERLRTSDIVLRGRGKHFIILMTETQREQAQLVMERMALNLPLRAIALTDDAAIKAGSAIVGFDARYRTQHSTANGPSVALLRGLQLGIFRSRAHTRHGQPAHIVIIDPGAMRGANITSAARPLDDLTRRVA